ncbi:MAG: ATP-binding protein [Phycisphaeraceae bacterium]
MREDLPFHQDRLLVSQLRWVVRLRWLAGLAVVVGALADALGMRWYDHDGQMMVIGGLILAYNAGFRVWLRRLPRDPRAPLALAWLQIVLDLGALSLLTLWTGDVHSPLLGFFVFHMVFASLLLPRLMAFAGAVLAIGLVLLTLVVSGRLPGVDAALRPRLIFAGWGLTLLLTVYLANHVTRHLRRHRRRLQMSNRRIRALSRRLQQQQQAMIQHEKSVAMGRMAAGLSHEIANPLANMDSMLQLAQRSERALSPQAVASLRQQIERISQIIRQMTSFAHPTEYTWETMAINDVVELGLRMLHFDRRQRQVTIDKQLAAEPVLVRVQPHAMQQVLINVLINAMDAVSEQAEARVVVRTQAWAGGGRIVVQDNGPGIDAANLPHLFEPFFTTKPVGKGTGLGLAISYTLMRNQGGDISITSEPGRSTTVTLTLAGTGAGADQPMTTEKARAS